MLDTTLKPVSGAPTDDALTRDRPRWSAADNIVREYAKAIREKGTTEPSHLEQATRILSVKIHATVTNVTDFLDILDWMDQQDAVGGYTHEFLTFDLDGRPSNMYETRRFVNDGLAKAVSKLLNNAGGTQWRRF